MTQYAQQAGFTEEMGLERRKEWHWPRKNPEGIQLRVIQKLFLPSLEAAGSEEGGGDKA